MVHQTMNKLVRRALGKTAILGGLSALGAGLSWGAWMALAVAAGALMVLWNVWAISWLIRKMFEQASRGTTSSMKWGALFMLKLLALFGLTYYCIARLGFSPVGFALGYSAFPAALVWQAVHDMFTEPEDDGEEADPPET
jgi:hypothetical protein